MIENIQRIHQDARTELSSATDSDQLEKLRVRYLGKKGLITGLLHQLKEVSVEQKRELGARLNEVKSDFERLYDFRLKDLERLAVDRELQAGNAIDVTLPGQYHVMGSLHPVTRIMDQMVACLRKIGFSVVQGPEVELEYFNFEALNTPQDHPARDLQDTFYIDETSLLRSHTSPVQIRAMKEKSPPIQIITPGKVYRSDYDVTHTPMFHQIEGLMVDRDISLADLKGVLHYLIKDLFGTRPLRFRPSYFPFTEPSAEVDMQCIQCKGSGRECRLCGSSGWLEIGGCGMVHPNVFKAVDYNPDQYSGFAFGIGIDRVAMLKYGIDDLRSLFENDYRLLEQF